LFSRGFDSHKGRVMHSSHRPGFWHSHIHRSEHWLRCTR